MEITIRGSPKEITALLEAVSPHSEAISVNLSHLSLSLSVINPNISDGAIREKNSEEPAHILASREFVNLSN